MIRNVLRCLPRAKKRAITTSIEEAQNVKILQLDLLGKLLIHDINLQKEVEGLCKKGVALKVAKTDYEDQSKSFNEGFEDTLVMIKRKFQQILKNIIIDFKKFSKGFMSKLENN